METCRRSSYRTFDLGIDGLIGSLVALLCFTVEIRRNWQLTHCVYNLGKAGITRPGKVDAVRGTMNRTSGGTHVNGLPIELNHSVKGAFLPFFQISYQTVPGALTCGLEHQLVVGRRCGFE